MNTFRPDSEFTIDSVKAMCHELKSQFEALLNATPTNVFAGKPGIDEHDGGALGGIIHLDQDALLAAHNNMATHDASLFGLALHETAHTIMVGGVAKYDHPKETVAPPYPYPFNYTSAETRGARNSCTR